MDWETYKKHEEYASEKNPSMHRRCIGHDYGSRCIYLITMTTEERKPLFGQLRGDADAPEGAADAPYIELSELGKAVKACWKAIEMHHKEVRVLAIKVMPDHLHGILFVEEQMQGHLGSIIRGFKARCNKEFRRLTRYKLQHCCSTQDNGKARRDGTAKDNY